MGEEAESGELRAERERRRAKGGKRKAEGRKEGRGEDGLRDDR
jgi:hypothetical protein